MNDPEPAIVPMGMESSSASSEWETELDSKDSNYIIESPGGHQITTAADHSFDHVLDDLPTSTRDSPTSKLCTCCQEVVNAMSMYAQKLKRQKRNSTQGITFRQDLLALVASAEAGCDLCFAFINGLQYDPDSHARIAKIVQERRNTSENTALAWGSVIVFWKGCSVDPYRLLLKFYGCREEGYYSFESDLSLVKQAAPGKSIFQTSDVVPDTNHSLPLAKKWLDACRRLHPACHNTNPSFIPTRLIDIRGLHPRLHLYQEFEKNQSVEYATLSHCWGNPFVMKENCTLTKSTLPLFTSKISLEEFPKTFLDAIQVCKSLDISYIWIDSLCILQDDKEDWNRESVTMNNVYSNGMINIAASSASDGSVGCFFERNGIRVCQLLIQIDDNTSVGYDCFPLEHPLESIKHCPLETRGWTFQERLLSPRTLHFTRTEVFWECFTKFVGESSPTSPDHRIGFSKQRYLENWATIVQQYSKRNLTFKKDRLIALAGIAAAIQDQTGDKYYAGMWGRNLERQLSWYLFPPALQRTTPPRAPTWSWANFDQLVFQSNWGLAGENDECMLQILNIENLSIGASPFGDMPMINLWLACPPLLIGFPWGDDGTGEQYFDCVEDMAALDIYVLKLDGRVGLLLRPTRRCPGEYRRVGLLTIFDEVLADHAESRSFHAQENAYVPARDHQFINYARVIVLV
ncbi:hypothetical protein LSUB1_G003953 [Lachnellula subtilissima]|uniref:Heterokaryon incompatibility domain-containing protein n=1 Tax=Lachnellula subtilissima TaxID=602034 RepID=A0A8H8UA20_9HELO|nr:hypothetical protein LSUB1_G003953 [Lachnellula subtilissima]